MTTHPYSLSRIFLISILIGVIAGSISGFLASSAFAAFFPLTMEEQIHAFYTAEVTSSMSPSEYVHSLEEGRPIATLIDLRAKGAYEAGHLAGARNIPIDQLTDQEIISAFANLPQDLPIVTYCYSSYCMLSRKVGYFLAQNGIFVKHLTAGGLEIMRDYEPYVVRGSEPGEIVPNTIASECPINSISGFSC